MRSVAWFRRLSAIGPALLAANSKGLRMCSSSSSSSPLTTTTTFATGNPKKLQEVERLLSGTGLTFANRGDINVPELQGDSASEIASEKCRLAALEISDGPVMTEDTSLCFNALKGLPGPYIKWFLQNCGHDGLNRMLVGFDDRTAYAQTIFAYTEGPGREVLLFEGRTNGTIVPARGKNDFGWDPIFECAEGDMAGKTYAEMSVEEKNACSHRAKSMAKLRAYLMKEHDGSS